MSSCGRNSGCTAPLTILPIQPGFHGASMGAVAREAGVATGTAYTHYASKDDLVLAADMARNARQPDGRDMTPGEKHRTPPMSEPPPAHQRAFWPTCAYARPGGRGTRLMLSRRPVQALDQGVVSLVRKHPLKPAPG